MFIKKISRNVIKSQRSLKKILFLFKKKINTLFNRYILCARTILKKTNEL